MKKIKSFLILLVLMGLTMTIYNLQLYLNIPPYRNMGLHMLGFTLIYYTLGWLFVTFNKLNWAFILGCIDFCFICVALFYSKTFVDFAVFILVILILLYSAIDIRTRIAMEEKNGQGKENENKNCDGCHTDVCNN